MEPPRQRAEPFVAARKASSIRPVSNASGDRLARTVPSGRTPSRASISVPDQIDPRTSRAAIPASSAPASPSASRSGKVAPISNSANSTAAAIQRLRPPVTGRPF